MIRGIVEFALNNRFLVVILALLLFVWGVISFERLPIEAYPDVANNYVQVITQWPGRAAEEVEQQVTIPIEIVMNGIPHLSHLRSTSLFGLVERDARSSTTNPITIGTGRRRWNGSRKSPFRRICNRRLAPTIAPWVRSISTHSRARNPQYDLMELKSLEDWVLEKQFKSVPNVVDVVSFGGTTREYQVRLDPDKLVSYGLNLAQVEQQLANNNVNAGGSFIEAGLQQVNVRALGLLRNVADIEATVIKTQNGTPVRVRDIAVVSQGPKIRLGQIGKAIHRLDGKVIDDDDVVEGIVLLRKGAESDATLDAHPRKGRRTERPHSAPGVKVVPFLDRSDLVHYTTHTVLHNLTEGIILVSIILFLFLGNARGALIVALTIPFSLLFAAICLDLRHIPANLLSLGALDFGMVVDGAVVMVENIVRHLGRQDVSKPVMVRIREAAHEVQRPVFYAIGIIITAYLPIFTLQSVEGRLFKPMAWTVAFALLGALIFSMLMAPVLSSFVFRRQAREWRNPVHGSGSPTRYRVSAAVGHRVIAG